ncbi:MAG: hypothetical protein IE922_02085 [Sphingomonadales bacterium]|nr:hypothetical protein [Sphingomonadales bacterium]
MKRNTPGSETARREAEMTREERLAEALRANLARRKAQARARKAAPGDEDQAEGTE